MRRIWQSTTGVVAAIGILLALATLAIGATVHEVAHEALEEQLDHRIATETRALLAEAARGGTPAVAELIARRESAAAESRLVYLLSDSRRKRLAGSLDAAMPPQPGYLEHLRHDQGQREAQALTSRLPDGGWLLVAADRAAVDATDRAIQQVTALAFGGLLLLGIAAAWAVGAITRARLNGIDRTALAIINGDLSQRIPVDDSGSEFDRVSITLNRMLDRIVGLLDNLREVSGNIAHDLRTPLTRLTNQLEAARASSEPGAHIDAALDQSRELLEIFAALLRISEVESHAVRSHFVSLSLSQLVTEVVETYRPDFEASGHRLLLVVAPEINVNGDRRLLQQLLANVLDNVLRHTPTGTTVQVTLAARAGHAELSIVDDGPGVPSSALPRLFQRFSVGDDSRATGGHGLGLALVAAIAAAHHGSVSAQSDEGLIISVTVPAGVEAKKALNDPRRVKAGVADVV
ncbi:ATP-binding protein [Nevskia sp.]|uniref:HAMP domain-containing sensor histidine kinase n=1 Tax=Nevskia sp. TaxID=1929292 RepID=UPI0025F7B885|nr:ATP-binding protein [Nevskia sp.]